MPTKKYLYWGPHLSEMDGGAIVNYYLLNELIKIRTKDKYWVVPKVPEEFDPSYIPFAEPVFIGNPEAIPDIMLSHDIPVVNLFHVGRYDFEKVIEPVHMIGGKLVLHQTIHWADDDVFKSDVLDQFDKIVTPTNWAREMMMKVAKISPRNIKVIPHAIPMNRFYPHESPLREYFNIKPEQKVFLYTGRLSLWKGVHNIIPAMRDLIKEFDCVFIFRGGAFRGLDRSAQLDYIISTIASRNPNVIFIPEWQEPSFMEELWGLGDFFLGPTAHEGFFVPLIEAMATKTPFVTTYLPNLVEVGGKSGLCGLFLIPEQKVGEVNNGTAIKVPGWRAIQNACRWLLENPEEAQIMGERGYRRCKKYFDLKKIAREWLKLYDQLIPKGYSMLAGMSKNLNL